MPRLRHTVLAGSALAAMLVWTGARHPSDPASDPESTSVAEAIAAGQSVESLLVDLVEPEDGEGGSEALLRDLAASLGAGSAGFYSEGEHLYRVRGDEAQLQALAQRLEGHPLVEGTEPELQYSLPDQAISAVDLDLDPPEMAKPDRPRFVPNDPMFPLQWHLEQIRAPEAWAHTRGAGAVVAVIDTGVAWKDSTWKGKPVRQVPDLAGIEFVHAASFVDGAMPDGLDDHAHGTHVAGTIAQSTDNGVGVAGVAHQAAIMPLKVLDGDGRGSVASIANAIRWAADHGAHAINMSLGGPLPSSVMAKAVAYAHARGVTVVCAAGNEKKSRVSYPAAYDGSVAVAATDFAGGRSYYSNWGAKLDISAPGGDTRADKNGDGHPDGVLQNTIRIQTPGENDYLWFQGTSMASPHAAGVAALIASRGVTNPDEVERILKLTARHPNEVKWDKEFGAGIIDAEAAVAASHESYSAERAGLAGGLGRLAFAGVGVRFASRRKLIGLALQATAGVALTAGLFLAPLATVASTWFWAPSLWLSVLPPLTAVLLGLQFQAARGLLFGLCLGSTALLLHGAVVLPTVLTDLPGGMAVYRVWLLGQAILCAWLSVSVFRAGSRSNSAP